ncbi:hypothetical protein C2845_PM13G24500 [Panicum miliaceum]|uniref:DNA polymerase delta subunit 4 n=1 Tax=Panicum miliaceum TaxID=4540 RepID=A0A3L6RJQ8_PANMI|nr:hypothetical protein C2845_PM13G24500 [Panicum miliaceum]
MAPPQGGLKGFYRQRKKTEPPAPAKKKPKNAQPQFDMEEAAEHGGEVEEEEEVLRQFDMDTSYGPCIGVTRLRRWERAAAMGLRPPPRVRDLVLRRRQHHGDGSSDPLLYCQIQKKSDSSSQQQQLDECLWAGKV